MPLVDRTDSVLVIVDMQPLFTANDSMTPLVSKPTRAWLSRQLSCMTSGPRVVAAEDGMYSNSAIKRRLGGLVEMTEVELRAIAPGDEPFLWRMLVEAASWRPSGRKLMAQAVAADANLARYVAGWGRDGDRGLVAAAGGVPVGAAWRRFFVERDHGSGFIDPAIPELSIALAGPMRGRGIGTALLQGLIEQAYQEGVPGLSLSVEHDNPAVRLYERLGFARVAHVGNAWTMLRAIG